MAPLTASAFYWLANLVAEPAVTQNSPFLPCRWPSAVLTAPAHEGWPGWVHSGNRLNINTVYPRAVTHISTNPARCRATLGEDYAAWCCLNVNDFFDVPVLSYMNVNDAALQRLRIGFAFERARFWFPIYHCCVTTLGTVFTPLCLCHRAV